MTKAKRKHANTSRLTARERIHAYQDSAGGVGICQMPTAHSRACNTLLKAFEAHARQALARERLRRK